MSSFLTDNNECELGLAEVPENAKCVNTPGNYTFKCCTGYKKSEDGKSCEGRNELDKEEVDTPQNLQNDSHYFDKNV